ncbi:MAG: transposase, partial [Treponema sp.]|nr:transposase [Treponema sp.]
MNQNIKNHLKKHIFKNNESYTIIRHNKKLNNFATHSRKTRKDTYITDATPVECDINILRKYISPQHLKKLRLKFGYSNSKGYFVGYKVTMVLEKNTRTPVSILIHPGAPNDSKIFDEVLKELKRRGLIKTKDLIYFDRGYFSYENYKIGINKYKIIPVIFPKEIFKINKFKDQMSYSLMIYKNKKEINDNKKLTKHLQKLLLIKLENWKDYKPIRGIIEDFFKAAKGAFGLGKFHSFTDKSMYKNIYLCLLLT